MSLAEDVRRRYFSLHGEERIRRSRVWSCNLDECKSSATKFPTDELLPHLCHGHRTLFLDLEASNQIKATSIARRMTGPWKGYQKKVQKKGHEFDCIINNCEFCDRCFANSELSKHRTRHSYIGGKYGCTKRNEFFNERKVGRELARALENSEELREGELDAVINSITPPGELGAVYIKMNAEWMSSTGMSYLEAERHWRYTGKAVKFSLKERMQDYRTQNDAAKIRLGVGHDEALVEGEKALKVLHEVPVQLAAAVEQALIVSRVTGKRREHGPEYDYNPHVNNRRVPYQVELNCGWDHKQLREFAARVLVSALKDREEVELVPESVTPTSPSTASHSNSRISGTLPSGSTLAATPSTSKTCTKLAPIRVKTCAVKRVRAVVTKRLYPFVCEQQTSENKLRNSAQLEAMSKRFKEQEHGLTKLQSYSEPKKQKWYPAGHFRLDNILPLVFDPAQRLEPVVSAGTAKAPAFVAPATEVSTAESEYVCKWDQCQVSFVSAQRLEDHVRNYHIGVEQLSHLAKKPLHFYCHWNECEHQTEHFGEIVEHVHNQHFNQPSDQSQELLSNGEVEVDRVSPATIPKLSVHEKRTRQLQGEDPTHGAEFGMQSTTFVEAETWINELEKNRQSSL